MSRKPFVEVRQRWVLTLAAAAALHCSGAAGAGQVSGAAEYERARYFGGATGKAIDETQGFDNLRRSALKGYLPAQVDLSFAYFNGKGEVPRNLTESFVWFRRAADQGSVIAQCMLGDFYRDGLGGIKKNNVQALKWYRLTASTSDRCASRSQFQLYRAYEQGLGVPQDMKQAVAWLEKAANAGNPVAQATLGHSYLKGYGVALNTEAGRTWLRKSREGVAPHEDEDEDAHSSSGIQAH